MRAKLFLFSVFFVVSGMTTASAMSVPEQNHLASPLQYPGAPKPVYDDRRVPYAMNYADEVAQNLGVRDGHMDVFSTQPGLSGYMPSITGGVGGDGAMVRLRWLPGQ
jgi:hypothetical protein